jgi:hypothetical protein
MLFGLVCANVRSEANSTHLIINRLVVSVGWVRMGGPRTNPDRAEGQFNLVGRQPFQRSG